MLTVLKMDSAINKDFFNNLSIVEIYNTACLLKNNSFFLTLLSKNRSGIPNSLIVDVENFKNFNLSKKLTFDFDAVQKWDSLIHTHNNVLQTSGIKIIEKISYNSPDTFFEQGDITSLIGRGGGLTPAGDDFIIGILNAYAFFSLTLFEDCKRKVQPLLYKTTSLSSYFLDLALQKRAGEDVLELLSALSAGNSQKIKFFTGNILNYGASSGSATLKGIIWALKRI